MAEFFYGRVFVGYAYAEGWAHYTEEMMLEAGLRGADPAARAGWALDLLLFVLPALTFVSTGADLLDVHSPLE